VLAPDRNNLAGRARFAARCRLFSESALDQEDMRLIARLKILLAKEAGVRLDLVRFATDSAYADEMLSVAGGSQSEALVMLAMQIMQRQGRLGAGAPAAGQVPAPPPSDAAPGPAGPPDDTAPDTPRKRYVGSLR
jgi:hypothetical protein